MTPLCGYCGEMVDLTKRTGWMRGIQGWEEPRLGGGANKVVLREVIPHKLAHSWCVEKQKLGVSENQGVMY